MVGTVTAVTHFGLFVTLDDLRLAGLLHVTQLPDDYYHFEVDRRPDRGAGAGDFALGDRLKVRLSQVDSEERRIDLAYEAQVSRGPRPARRGRRRRAERQGTQGRGSRGGSRKRRR